MPNSKAAKRQLNPSSWGLEVFEGGLKELLRAVVDACYWNTRLLIAPWLRFNEPFQLSHSMFKSLSRWSTNQCEPHNILSKHTTRFNWKKAWICMEAALGCAALKSSAATALLSFNLWRNTFQKQDIELLTKEENHKCGTGRGNRAGHGCRKESSHGPTPVEMRWQNAEELRICEPLTIHVQASTATQQPQHGGQRTQRSECRQFTNFHSLSFVVSLGYQDPPCLEIRFRRQTSTCQPKYCYRRSACKLSKGCLVSNLGHCQDFCNDILSKKKKIRLVDRHRPVYLTG